MEEEEVEMALRNAAKQPPLLAPRCALLLVALAGACAAVTSLHDVSLRRKMKGFFTRQ